VRGLRTLVWKVDSLSLLTMRRAWLAVKRLFSFGGEPDMVAAVGLRARLCRELSFEARDIDPERLNALLIFALSERSTFQPSLSEEELFALSLGLVLRADDFMILRDDEFVARSALMVRRGEFSLSEDERLVIVGGGGDPSVFFLRKPA